MNIGLFFGSFNPITIGHLLVAEGAMNSGFVNEVRFVVSPQNPFKKDNDDLIDVEHRLDMARLAIKDNKNFKEENIEISLPKPSYTINTLKVLEQSEPENKFFIIMGADVFNVCHSWKDFDYIKENFEFLIFPRYGYDESLKFNKLYGRRNVNVINVPQTDFSATYVRKLISNGKSIKYQVSDNIIDYIYKNELYLK